MYTLLVILHVIAMVGSIILMSGALIVGLLGKRQAAAIASYGMFATAVGALSGAALLLMAPILLECVVLTAYIAGVTALYVFGFAMGSADEAQDVVQETFFRAFRSLASYKQTDSRFTTYLGRIASNLITDMWRKKGRSPINSNVTDIQDRLVGGENPADALLATEKKQTLAAALNELPPEQRQVIEYRILAGLPVRDVALAMDKSEAAIKMLQQRALKNLREKLLAKGGWQEDEQ